MLPKNYAFEIFSSKADFYFFIQEVVVYFPTVVFREMVKEYRTLKKTNHTKERTIRKLAQEAQETNNTSMTGR